MAIWSDFQDGGRIHAAVTKKAGLAAEASGIELMLPESLRGSVSITLSDAPVAIDESAFGGM